MLLWTAYFVEGLTYITLANWMAVVLQDIGLSQFTALSTVSYASAGGILVSLCLMRPLDKIGPMASVVTAVVAIAAIVTLGTPGVPQARGHCRGDHRAFLLLGNPHLAQRHGRAVLPDAHPQQRHRSWASALGRVSSIIGPIIVGDMFSAHISLQDRALRADAALFRADRRLDSCSAGLYVRRYSQHVSPAAELEVAPAAE